MEVESKPVNESGDKKEEMTSADYYFDRYVQFSTISILVFFNIFIFSENWVFKKFVEKNLIFSRDKVG